MTRILFDARMADMSGIGTYIRNLLDAMRPQWPAEWELSVLSNEHHPGIYSLAEQRAIPRAFRASGASLLHVPHYNVPARCVKDCIVTVHDLIHLLFPQYLPSRVAWLYAQTFFRAIVPRARRILTVSEHTKSDLIKHLRIPAEKIIVTPLGVSPAFSPDAARGISVIRERWWLPEPYLLYVGNLKEFKNVVRLVDAYEALHRIKPHCPALVLAGRNFIEGFEERLKQTPGIVRVPVLQPVDLPALYAGALGFVYPSLYEGFGLPPLEAMACGTPVLCSSRASLAEVVGDAALIVNPEDPVSIRRGMERLVEDPELRATLREKGLRRASRFTWSVTAAKTIDAYRQCLA